jgi:SCP-2 sterol transfer family protein
MARYLSPEWVQSFDDALGALDLTEAIAAAGAGSLAAADGAFSVVQVVTAEPGTGADTHLVLSVAEGRAHLRLDPQRSATGTATIVLDHADALALAHGALDPADALAEGRVRVRGDLAALVAGQEILAAAAALLGPRLVGLTDPTDPD